MLCCHKYPHKYCVFLDSCERAYFRWMIAEHKDVLLKDVFASHTFLRPTPFFFFLFFFSDVWDSILQPHWPDWSLSETTCCFIQHNNQASNCLKYSLHFFFFDIPSQTNDVMPQHYSFFFFFCTNVPESQSCRFSRVTLQCSTCRHMKLHHLL